MAQEFPHYARAPLAEATIEFRLAEPLLSKTMESLRRRFARRNWKQEEVQELEFVVGLPNVRITPAGFRFTSDDGAQIISLGKSSVGCSVLAPYPGWEAFTALTFDCFALWRKEVSRPIARIGLRYVNRFDIPCAIGQQVNLNDYLAFVVHRPAVLDRPLNGYGISMTSGIEADNLGVTINSATAPSPLVDHLGVVLDFDIFRDVDVPQEDSDIRDLLDRIRHRRTEIFEACLTPATRALIS